MAEQSIPILMYHQVAPQRTPVFAKYTVTPRAFTRQMEWLRLAGYTTMTLDALLAWQLGRGRLPRRPVVITFDDGFQACIDHAVPILLRRQMTATFYLVAGRMGQASDWLLDERGVAFPLIDWQTAHRLEAAGMHCGAHTLTHPRLTQVDAATRRTELAGARALMAQELGHPIDHLAYPFGCQDYAVRAMAAAAGYRSACGVEMGRAMVSSDPLALRRIPISGHDTLADFVCRLHTGRALRRAIGTLVARRRPEDGIPAQEVTR